MTSLLSENSKVGKASPSSFQHEHTERNDRCSLDTNDVIASRRPMRMRRMSSEPLVRYHVVGTNTMTGSGAGVLVEGQMASTTWQAPSSRSRRRG